jgi:hypothetical protein
MDQSPTHDMYISHSPCMIEQCVSLSSHRIEGQKHSDWPSGVSITQVLNYSLLVDFIYWLVCFWVCGWYLPIIWDSLQIKNTLILCSNVYGSGWREGGATAGATRSMEPGKPFKHSNTPTNIQILKYKLHISRTALHTMRNIIVRWKHQD